MELDQVVAIIPRPLQVAVVIPRPLVVKAMSHLRLTHNLKVQTQATPRRRPVRAKIFPPVIRPLLGIREVVAILQLFAQTLQLL